MPGKAAALSAACAPAVLTGSLPVIYPFIVNNPGEAATARRRLGAVTIGHMTPPVRQVDLSPEMQALERLIDEYAEADGWTRAVVHYSVRRFWKKLPGPACFQKVVSAPVRRMRPKPSPVWMRICVM
nr:cobaltochelatase subunit CobN [Acetobacter persici]